MKVAVPKEGQFSLLMSYSILALIFIFDLFVPLGIFGGVPYVIGMIVVMWLLKPHEILTFGVFCGILALGGFFSEDIASGMEGLINRFMAIFTIVAIAWLIRQHTSLEDEFKEKQKHLSSVIDKRTVGLKQIVDQLDEYKIRLAESEELGHFGFWEFSPATQQMTWSNGVFSIYDFPVSPQAPSMQEFLDQCHVEDLETLQRSIQYGLNEKKSYVVEYRLVMPDGSLKWIYNRGRPILNQQGYVELLIGTIQDITSRKHSEETVTANRARYTTLFKSAAVAKALMIPNKKILEVNAAFCEWIGYSERELLKIPIEKLIHKDDRSMEDAYAGDLMSGSMDFFQREKRFVRKDGEVVWALFSVSAVFDASDKVSCFAAEIVDLTRQKRAEEARDKAEEAWHDAEEALTESEAARRLAEVAMREAQAGAPANTGSVEMPPAPAFEEEDEQEAVSHFRDDVYDEPPVAQPLYADVYEEPAYDSATTYEEEVLGEDTYVEDSYEDLPDAYDESPSVREVYAEPDSYREEPDPVDEEDFVKAEPDAIQQPLSDRNPSFEMAEEVIDQLFQLSDGFMAIIGEDRFYKRLSPALNKALGYQEGVLEDQYFLDFVHDDDLEATETLLDRLFAGESIESAKFRHRCHDASFEWFTWNATFNHEHKVIYSVFYAVPAEETRPKPKRDANVDWRRLTDKMPFQIWMLDTERSCRYANKKVRDFTGLPFEQLEGTGWGKSLHPEHFREYKAYQDEQFDLREPMQFTYKLRRSDGSYRSMQETSMPLFSTDNRFEGYLVTCMDVSNLRAIQGKFQSAFEGALDLEDLSSALRQCRRDECQHALRDSIKIADALIEYGAEVPHEDLAGLMEHAGEQLLDMVNSVLSFSEMEAEPRDMPKRSVSIGNQVESVVDMLAPLKRDGGPRFKVSLPEEEVLVQTDKVLLHRILENLMRHLIERADSRVIAIDVNVQNRRGTVAFRHIGDVVDPSFFAKLGDLYREKTSDFRLQKYAGLELALAKKLIDVMGGTLTILREREIGPIILIQFPLFESVPAGDGIPGPPGKAVTSTPEPKGRRVKIQEVVDAIENMSRQEAPPKRRVEEEIIAPADQASEATDSSRPRVLIGESNPETQRLVRSLLQPYYELMVAEDTAELLSESEKEKFDLVLLDVHLPGDMSGKEVLRELRKNPEYYRTPAIAVATGTSAIDQRELIDRAGFDGFLRKPFSIVELLETVERLIEV